METGDPSGVAAEILAVLDSGRQLEPISGRVPGFDATAAYGVAAELRRMRIARGETPVGRKIGFTNRNIWQEYGVFQPIWGDVYDTTLRDILPGAVVHVAHLPEPRIEPEIVLCIGRDLSMAMSLEEVEDSIEWVAHGYEIVQSVFPAWRFGVADCIADGGLHGALCVGPRHAVPPEARRGLAAKLAGVTVSLSKDGTPMDSGVGANALDGPIHALMHLAAAVGTGPEAPTLRAGEIITTGTLTRAFPVLPGERWATETSGSFLAGLDVVIG